MTAISPLSMFPRIKWWCTLMCLVLPLKREFFDKSIAPLVSHCMSKGSSGRIISSSMASLRSHKDSCAAADNERYSASVLGKATVDCRLLFQLIAAPCNVKVYPVVKRGSSESVAQLVSQYPVSRLSASLEYWSLRFLVPCT